MNTLLILLFTFSATALLAGTVFSVIYDAWFRYPASVRDRIAALSGKNAQQKNSLLLDIKQLAESTSGSGSDWRSSLRNYLEQSGTRISMPTLVGSSLSLGVAGAMAIALVTHLWLLAPLGLVAGAAVPWAYIHFKRQSRLHQMTMQLPHVMDIICRGVRAGQTLPAAFQMVADDFAPPISEEFRSCYEQQNLGISYDTALRNLARSSGIMELRILIVALLVQARSGGNLTELLGNLSSVMRKRLSLQQKVKALTGEGRMQAAVLVALPIVVFIAMYVLNREYAQVLLDRPWLLGGCIVSQAIGALCIQKIIRIDY